MRNGSLCCKGRAASVGKERVGVMPRKRAKKLRERIVETPTATTETYP
ncbi:MAG TPA: hypothetical protein PKE31_21265 [Pseudomonadota bacterium]|nr:hypothetical protein [Pseudomonadota bacterium]